MPSARRVRDRERKRELGIEGTREWVENIVQIPRILEFWIL